jgi:putative membrane protein
LLKIYLGIFICYWVFTGATATDFINWVLENSLTIPAVILLIEHYPWLPFSNARYSLIQDYFQLHLYGRQHAYADNPFGFWLQEKFHTSRNHYDRIVHFSFGFLLAYPVQEVLAKVFKAKSWRLYVIPIELALALSAFYEIVEWLVAGVCFPEAGSAFLGAQGDVWDSQKDLFVATLGAFMAMLYLLLRRNLRKKPEKR